MAELCYCLRFVIDPHARNKPSVSLRLFQLQKCFQKRESEFVSAKPKAIF